LDLAELEKATRQKWANVYFEAGCKKWRRKCRRRSHSLGPAAEWKAVDDRHCRSECTNIRVFTSQHHKRLRSNIGQL
jgi:hypothetical protein